MTYEVYVTTFNVTERVEILDRMMEKMRRSAYDQDQRLEVLYAGTLGYCRMMYRERVLGRRINRPREEGEEERKMWKIVGDSTWFRNKEKEKQPTLEEMSGVGLGPVPDPGGNRECNGGGPQAPPPRASRVAASLGGQQQPDTVVFVPATDDSKLRKALQTQDKKFAGST